MAQVQRLCCPILVKLWHTFAYLIGSGNCMWTTCELNEGCVRWKSLVLPHLFKLSETDTDVFTLQVHLSLVSPPQMPNGTLCMQCQRAWQIVNFWWVGLVWHITPSARRCQCLPMFVENKIFPWRVDSTQQTMLVVTRRLCRSGHVDWWVQRRALSTTSLKTVYKYCRMVLCLSAALVIYKTAVYWQRASQHTLWQAPYILRYCC